MKMTIVIHTPYTWLIVRSWAEAFECIGRWSGRVRLAPGDFAQWADAHVILEAK